MMSDIQWHRLSDLQKIKYMICESRNNNAGLWFMTCGLMIFMFGFLLQSIIISLVGITIEIASAIGIARKRRILDEIYIELIQNGRKIKRSR